MSTISPITEALDIRAATIPAPEAPTEPALVVVADPLEAELERLRQIQIERGSIPAADYDEAQRLTGYSRRQIQRKLAELRVGDEVPHRKGFELTEHHRQVIMASQGNVAQAYRELTSCGELLPNLDTFWRAWNREPTGMQAYARKGAAGMSDHWLYLNYEAGQRNDVWQADHFELPVDVIADGHTTTLVKPWLTLFVDDKSRKVMSWSLTATPGSRADAQVVRATIVAGIRIRLEDGVEVGGVPARMRWDNDLSFTADTVVKLGTKLGFECKPVPPYSGHMKGKIERLGRTVQEKFCTTQPGYTHGPKTYTNKDPFRDTDHLTAEQLRARLSLWFAEYDRTFHQGIKMTPLERWMADTTPLRRVSDELLRSGLLVFPAQRKVIKRKGVHFKGRYWTSAALNDIVGRTIEVHYPVGIVDFIEIYKNGDWSTTGLTDSQESDLLDRRQAQYQEARALHDEAVRLRAGANAQMGTTDATPAIASMPVVDPLTADMDDLLDLIGDEDS
jgi:putative transposase